MNFFGQVTNFFGEAIDTVGDVVGDVSGFITSLPGRFYDAGDRISDELAEGTRESREEAVRQQSRRMFGEVGPLVIGGAVIAVAYLLLANR